MLTMSGQLDESGGSCRDSVIYDDVASEGDLSKDRVSESKNKKNEKDNKDNDPSVKKDTQGAGKLLNQQAKKILPECIAVDRKSKAGDEKDSDELKKGNGSALKKASHIPDQESPEDKRRLRRNSNDKELWTPVKPEDENKACKQVGDHKDSQDSQPTKPPRRQPQKRGEFKGKSKEPNVEGDQQNLTENDTATPQKRRLPKQPKPRAMSKGYKQKEIKTDSTSTESVHSTSGDRTEEKPTEIVCKPVVTSSPNSDEVPSLAVMVDTLDTSRRVLSYLEASPEGSKGTAKKVESFYDFLYSQNEVNAVVNVTLPSLRTGGKGSSGDTILEEHPYDDVPMEDGVAGSVGKRSLSGSTYEEVIVNQEAYVMPSHDEESDEFSENDPWGSDFETEDDLTDAGSVGAQDDFNDDEVEEDPYDSVEISPMLQRKRPFKFVPELTNFSPFKKSSPSLSVPGLKGHFTACLGFGKPSASMPYSSSSSLKQKVEETDGVYVDPDITDTVNFQQPVMPPMPSGLSLEQIKRYQIVKFMLESEADYMRLLDQLSKQYELPIRERDLLESSKIDTIFQHVHRVLQCHAMFNIALSARMADWTPDEKIGDILYALFCKSIVLDAYSGYVNNFSKAMDTVKLACRTHLAFSQFLKARRQASRERHSLHYLMLKPIQRFPQILALLQELLIVTPLEHPDHVPLQLALTQLECLAENLKERKREAELRNKVKLLDGLIAQSHKPLVSGNRYFIRQDDFVQCTVEGESILGTKKRRIIMLSDMLLCVSLIKGKKDRARHMVIDPRAKYKLKWNVPLNDVNIVEYGPGVNISTSSYRTTISHSKEGQYRKAYSGCREHFEDLQQDLAVIGQIAGLVTTLRRSYQVLDTERVQQWHKAVQRTIEEETRLANLYWLELSLPSKHGAVNYIFSTDSPIVKAEWVTALNTSKLRLSADNNPGWYLPEDDGTGGVAIQRRNMPLLKDNSSLFLLSQKTKVHSIVSVPDSSEPLPGIHDNYNNLWLLCGDGDHAGHVAVLQISLASPPQVVESFHVSDSSIVCGEYVERTCGEEKKFKGTITGRFGFPFPTVWLGTQGGRIFIYNAVDSSRRYVMSVKLPDAVLDIKTVNLKIFAGVADGSLVIFKRNKEGTWNFSEPKAVALGKEPVMAIAIVAENLWCSCGNKLFVINHDDETIKRVIEVDENSKASIKHLVNYGVGVWVSVWKNPSIKLFHGETMKHVQDISIVSPVTNMQRDIDSQLEKTKLDRVYVTALTADEGLLWIGTSVGVTLVFPLPRLEGIPLVSGKACVAFHSYCSSVRCVYPLKNDPTRRTGHVNDLVRPDVGLFREHEVRDACVQTDPGVSGAWGYASRGPVLANQSEASSYKVTSDNAATRKEGVEDDSGEDVRSDDDFNFVEDRDTLNGMRISSLGTGTLSVRFEQPSSPTSIASSVQSDEFVGKTQFRVDDFARMLSEFKGFGTSPPVMGVSEPARIPMLVFNEVDGATSGEGEGTVTGSGKATISGETSESEVDLEFSRTRVKSVGEYVKLNEARAAAQGLTLRKNNAEDGLPDTESESETGNIAGNQLTSGDAIIPSYVEVLDDSQAPAQASADTEPKEPIYDSPRKDDSYSLFERSQERASEVAGGSNARKVENLKPRLPFPVLLVSAGEGYADLRRKRPSEHDKEPRIMIWQIS